MSDGPQEMSRRNFLASVGVYGGLPALIGSAAQAAALGWYNAKDYNVVGNGVADDQPALNRLANATIPASSGGVLYLPAGEYRIQGGGANLTTPERVALWMAPGAKFMRTGTGGTLTINGELIAGLHQVFSGQHVIVLGSRRNREVYPQWWGAGSGAGDETRPIQQAVDCAGRVTFGGRIGRVFLTGGYWKITAPVVVPSKVHVEGAGQDATSVQKTTTTAHAGKDCAFYIAGERQHISGMTISRTPPDGRSCAIYEETTQSSLAEMNVQGYFNAIASGISWLTSHKNIRAGSCSGYGFDFSSPVAKTTLDFENCYAEACAGGFSFRETKGALLRGCSVDWCNVGGLGGGRWPGGHGYGSAAKGNHTARSACYRFHSSTAVLDCCNAEYCYAQFIQAEAASNITVNSPFVVGIRLNVGGNALQAFASIDDITRSTIRIHTPEFTDIAKSGASGSIWNYYVPAGSTEGRIIVDGIQAWPSIPSNRQANARVLDALSR